MGDCGSGSFIVVTGVTGSVLAKTSGVFGAGSSSLLSAKFSSLFFAVNFEYSRLGTPSEEDISSDVGVLSCIVKLFKRWPIRNRQ